METAPAASGWRVGLGDEFDPAHCPEAALNMDFAYPVSQRFDTIIGNPPYVRFQDISLSTPRAAAAGSISTDAPTSTCSSSRSACDISRRVAN